MQAYGQRHWRIVLTVIAAVAVIYAVWVTWRQHERAAGLDFYIYFVNAQLAGRDDIANTRRAVAHR
jgi:hypothetical protein